MPRNFPDWRRGDPADAERLTRQHRARNQGIVGGHGIDVVRGHDGVVIQLKKSTIIPSTCCDIGACCVPGEMTGDPVMCVPDVAEAVCLSEGGEWTGPGVTCDPDPCVGACCIDADSPPDGISETCVPGQSKVNCEAMEGGEFKGVGSKCMPNPCDEGNEGACCFGPACIQKTESECMDEEGMFKGVGVPCVPNPCLLGACCTSVDNLVCVPLQTPEDCAAEEGIFQGAGTGCVPDPCTGDKGACCFGGACVPDQTPGQCSSELGIYQGHGTVCMPNPCMEQKGACCTGAVHNECVPELLEPVCVALGGIWQGHGVPCVPIDPCLPQNTGACCIELMPSDGHVQCVPNRTSEQCADINGLFQGIGVNCFPNPCLGMKGACCFGPTCVAEQTADECSGEGGIYQGDNVPCVPNPCPMDPDDPLTPGACCVGPICHPNHTRESCCLLEGNTDFFPNVDCTPNPCGNDTGACCTGAAHNECVPDVTEGECCLLNMMPGHWVGAGSTCEPDDPCLNVDTTGACCWGPFDNMPPFNQECTPNLTQAQCDDFPQPHSWHPNVPCVPLPDACMMNVTTGACCFGPFDPSPGGMGDQECEPDLTLNECNAKPAPHSWHPGEPCIPLPIECTEDSVWACCTGPTPPPDQNCVPTTQGQCAAMGGDWYLGQNCWPDECLGDPDTGACCLPPWPVPNPECEDNWTVNQCNAVGGGWFVNQMCIPAACNADTTPGACCYGEFDPDQMCTQETAFDCLALGGNFLGPGVLCDPLPFVCQGQPDGACCYGPFGPDQECVEEPEAECALRPNSNWHGPGSSCVPLPEDCTQTEGACCYGDFDPNQMCIETDAVDCANNFMGNFQGPGTTCMPLPAPCVGALGACCIGPTPPPDQICQQLTADQCGAAGGDFQGVGVPCDPLPPSCESKEWACCFGPFNPVQFCAETDELECGEINGTWYQGELCGPPLPDQCTVDQTNGVCCLGPEPGPGEQQECNDTVDQTMCLGMGGDWLPGIANCDPNPCPSHPEHGACCLTGQGTPGNPEDCIENHDNECLASGGVWQGAGTVCFPNPCRIIPPPGACCIGPIPEPGLQQDCLILTQADCKIGGGDWLGIFVPCDPNRCPFTPIEPQGACCCPPSEGCTVLSEAECLEGPLPCFWIPAGFLTDPCNPNPCLLVKGACCVRDPLLPGDDPDQGWECLAGLTLDECVDPPRNGEWQGANTNCREVDCAQRGACCIGDQGSCIDDQTEFECTTEGGTFQGVGTLCADIECPIIDLGRCCLPNGECIFVTEEDCLAQDGMWTGGQDCSLPCTGEAVDCCITEGPSRCLCLEVGTPQDCFDLQGEAHVLGWCALETPDNPQTCCSACCHGFLSQECDMFLRADECLPLPGGIWHPGLDCIANAPCPICCCFFDAPGCQPPGEICPAKLGPPCAIGGMTLLECTNAGGVPCASICCSEG